MANGSHFEWGCDGYVIRVKDLDKRGMSLTNNIDRVLDHLDEHLLVRGIYDVFTEIL